MVEPKSLRGSGARSMALLKLVAEFGGEFSLSDIAARAGLPVSSVHRLMRSLIEADLVERARAQAYRPGAEFFSIARLLLKKADKSHVARPLLQELWDQWHETSAFCLYQPHSARALVVDTIQTPHPLRYVLEPHTEISLVWGSLGRAILAFMPPQERDAAIDTSPRTGPLSGARLPAKRVLTAELAEVKERGVAIYQNVALDLAGIAAPVRQSDGTLVGSIGIIMPNSRFRARSATAMVRSVQSATRRFTESAAGA
jgi:DNA-binding IclR family transcriptional regulator